MTDNKRFLLAAAAFAMTVAGCECPDGSTDRSTGEVRLRFGTAESEADEYDFGIIPMGTVVEQTLVVQNVGRGPFTITLFSKPDSAQTPVKVGSHINDDGAVFEVAFDEATSVRSSDSVELNLKYAPPLIDGDDVVDHLVQLHLHADNTISGGEVTPFTLKGRAIKGDCVVPERLDFGAVARGDAVTIEYEFVNNRAIETRVLLSDIVTPVEGVFTASPESPKGEFDLASGASKKAAFTFRPSEGGTAGTPYQATVIMRRATDCPEREVQLVGIGVDTVLAWSPAQVNFGYVSPGSTVTREVTITNLSNSALTLSPISITGIGSTMPSTLFQFTDTGTGEVTGNIVVPPGTRVSDTAIAPGSVTVRVGFSPQPNQLGRHSATLNATTTLESQPLLAIPMVGVGGGPRIDAPALLDLGRIAYFPNATSPVAGMRTLAVRNIGAKPVPADPAGNLRLGTIESGLVAPYWEVEVVSGGTLDEICVGVFDTTTQQCTHTLPETGPYAYVASEGIEAGSASSRLDIPVRVMPTGYGAREWRLRIFSNDQDTPVKTVSIKAKAEPLQPCDITIAPSPLHFGILTPPQIKDLAFSIRNNSTEHMCVLSNLKLGPETGTPAESPAVFSLPGGEVQELELQPGASEQFFVRAWPQGTPPDVPVQVQGKVTFEAAHPDQPQREVVLAGAVGNSCLTIAPSAVNFGTVKVGCYSQIRSFEVYNTCTSAVTINTSALGAQALIPPGQGECPADGPPCPEFFQIPVTPNGTVLLPNTGTPASFQVRYRPLDHGSDTGSVVLNVTQGGVPVDYVVPLLGTGNASGINVDTFQQTEKPKADILLVIDDSCSMLDEQIKLGANMDAFLAYAVSNQVDFRIAVTTTDGTGTNSGRFCHQSSGATATCTRGNTVLTPTTENLETHFANLVKVGTSGSATETCMKPAADALTAPNITTPSINGGFLRDEAILAVVCITDATDQASGAWGQYLSQLMSVKGAQRANMFTYNVIGPFAPPSTFPGCSYDGSQEPTGGGHTYMVAQTNGEKGEICEPDWGPMLDRVGRKAFGYRDTFFLTSVPDLGSPAGIVVHLDGVPVPATSEEGALIWHYDASTNTIVFQPAYVPTPGETLTVEYEALCLL